MDNPPSHRGRIPIGDVSCEISAEYTLYKIGDWISLFYVIAFKFFQ